MDNFLLWFTLTMVIFWLVRRHKKAPKKNQASAAEVYRKHEFQKLIKTLPNEFKLPESKWKALSFEEISTSDRRRVVLSIELGKETPDEYIEPLLWRLALTLQRNFEVHVVVIEAFLEGNLLHKLAGSGAKRLLFSIDGRGWTGSEGILAILQGAKDDSKIYNLLEVQQWSIETLDASSPAS